MSSILLISLCMRVSYCAKDAGTCRCLLSKQSFTLEGSKLETHCEMSRAWCSSATFLFVFVCAVSSPSRSIEERNFWVISSDNYRSYLWRISICRIAISVSVLLDFVFLISSRSSLSTLLWMIFFMASLMAPPPMLSPASSNADFFKCAVYFATSAVRTLVWFWFISSTIWFRCSSPASIAAIFASIRPMKPSWPPFGAHSCLIWSYICSTWFLLAFSAITWSNLRTMSSVLALSW